MKLLLLFLMSSAIAVAFDTTRMLNRWLVEFKLCFKASMEQDFRMSLQHYPKQLYTVDPAVTAFNDESKRIQQDVNDTPTVLKEMLFSLRNINEREHLLLHILDLDNKEIQSFTRGDLKLIIAACVQSEEFGNNLSRFLKKLELAGRIDSEIMFVAIRLCCKRKHSALAKFLLMEVKKYGLTVDLSTVNAIVQMLIQSGDIADAIELLEAAQSRAFGEPLQCDMSTFSLIIESASRLHNRDLMRRAFDLVYRDEMNSPISAQIGQSDPKYTLSISNNQTASESNLTNIIATKPKQNANRNDKSYEFLPKNNSNGTMDISALTHSLMLSASVGDMTATMEIFEMINRTVFPAIPSQVYCFVLSAFLVRPLNFSTAKIHQKTMFELIVDAIATEVDRKDSNLSNLVLRYLVNYRSDEIRAEIYLKNMINEYKQRPSALAMYEYALALTTGNCSIDVIGCTRLQHFALQIGLKSLSMIRKHSLKSCEIVGRNASISLLLLRSAIQQVREEGVSIIDFEECDRPCFFLFRSLTDILMRIGKEKESKRIIYNLTVLVLEDIQELILFLPVSNRPSLMDFLTVTELVAKILPGFMKPPYAQAFTEFLTTCGSAMLAGEEELVGGRKRIRAAAADLGRSRKRKIPFSNGEECNSTSSSPDIVDSPKTFKGFAKKAVLLPPS